MRYIWIDGYASIPGVVVGSKAELNFVKGTGGAIGGHWSLWKVSKLV